jgi:transcriptional regulator with XRE-family HTH domain/Zn-dependent peptidase ImmA (M78 family)
MATRGKNIGQVLREARKSRGLTQAEIAPTLGVSRTSIAQMENGKRAVRAQDVERLALRYGCSTGELLSSEHHGQSTAEDIVLRELFAASPELQREETYRPFRQVLHVARMLTAVESTLGFETIANVLPSYAEAPPETAWHAARQGYRASEDERRRSALGEGPIRFVDELVATMGVRTARARLPRGVNVIFVNSPETGSLVVVDEFASVGRRRLNYAHGMAHALFDRHLGWRVCSASAEMDFREVRANAFASGFLLPEHGVQRYVETLGKETLGRSGPSVLSIHVEGEVLRDGNNLRIDGRAREGRHPITFSDLTLAAHYYGATRSLTAHRLRNLRLLSDEQIERFERMIDSDTGRNARRTLALKDVPYETDSLCSRLAALAAEAYNRKLIDSDAFSDCADVAGVPPEERSKLLELSTV